ncbi:hypothetical protein [Tenggerimyces flavus]|uniref:Uncharacterized protein n=1 Tax=Tenggerimyces flavus TaxID=1708749 RepID=A0ABV7YH90_9ACTN|nr:hypothetical protein [Tenggerimyces flavus]MBM7783943.1 hypothetical protein [Tenggerimyces flavus]
MRVRAALAWTLGLVAAVVGLGHGAASAQQPTSSVRMQAFSASSGQSSRGTLVESNSPIAVAVASKTSAKQHRTAPIGLVASNWTLDRPTAYLAEPTAAVGRPAGTSSRGANVRGPPGAPRA